MSKQLKRLLELTNEIAKLDPWEWLYDIDVFAIQPRRYLEPFFISIMGYQGNCYGMSIYYGSSGYADLDALAQENPGLPVSYLMSDINCLTCYFAEEEELDDDTLWAFQEYNIVPNREDRYFYYLSFEPRYYPFALNDEQINVAVDALEGFYFALNEWMNKHTIDANWEKGEIIFACEDEDGWNLSTVLRPHVERDYPVFIVDDDYLEELMESPHVSNSLAMELIYCNAPVFDDEGILEKPMNPLMLIVEDQMTGEFVYTDFLQMDEEPTEIVFDVLTDYIEKQGIPSEVHYHNPYIKAAIDDVCMKLDIDMVYDELEDLNEFIGRVIQESVD